MLTKPETEAFWPCVEYYLALCLAKGQSPETVAAKLSGLKLFFRWYGAQGLRGLQELTLDVMDGYQEMLHQYKQPDRQRPLSKGTIRNRLTVVRVFMQSMYLKGMLAENPLARFELPSPGRRLPMAIFSEAEIEKMLAQALVYGHKGIRDRAVLETYYATGIRRSELGRLLVDDLDMAKRMLRVNRGKGDKDRMVPIAKRACEWIMHYLHRIRPGLETIHSGMTLFLTNEGEPFTPRKLSGLAAKYVKLAGIRKPGACNLYRHATATLMLENGADIRHVQEMLGHADISTTQIYTHVTITKLREVYERTHPAACTAEASKGV